VDGEKKRTMLVILGAGLFAEEIADIIAELDVFDLAGFIEGVSPERCRQTLCGLPIIWIDDIAPWIDDCLRFTSVFHPSATIAKTATLGEGSIAGAGAVVAARARIGSHVILNRGCLIGHHGVIGDYVTVSPGANIAGKVHIGDQSYIGMGATVLDGISIGKGAVVGAGAVVTRDVPDRVQVIGVPARVVKSIY
jgi:serine acetyltransferase